MMPLEELLRTLLGVLGASISAPVTSVGYEGQLTGGVAAAAEPELGDPAHHDRDAWAGMVDSLQRAKRELGKACRVEMDLAGPKLRTRPIDPASQIVKWRPQRDIDGHVTAPVQVWLTSAESPEPPRGLVGGCLS